MSELLKNVFLNYIICSVLGGALEYAVPERMRKSMRIAIVAVMVLSLFSPIAASDVSFESFSFEETESREALDSLMHIANLTEEKVYNEVRAVLINSGVDEYEIYVEVTPEKDENTVYLDSVKILLGQEYGVLKDSIKAKISSEYKAITEVGVKNE